MFKGSFLLFNEMNISNYNMGILPQAFDNLGAGVVPATAFLLCFLGFIAFCLLLTFDNDKAYEKGKIFVEMLKFYELSQKPC